MRILVTGGMGAVGRPTVEWLMGHGHTVRVLDLSVDEPIPGAECREGDITDFASLSDHMQDMQGVVHLAAFPHPSMAPPQRIFQVNDGGTFNVFQAAIDANKRGDAEIRRIVCAGSINALGYNFGVVFPEDQIRYFPIDEQHPTYTTDPYSFSKRTIEEIGGYFWRREGLSSLFLRYPAIYDLNTDEPSMLLDFVEGARQQTAAVMSLPEQERQARIAEIIADFKRRARGREWEKAFDWSFPDAHIMLGRSNFWTCLDVRDAAQAAEKGLLADYAGSHPVYVTQADNFIGLPSRELAEAFFPDVTTWKKPVTGTQSLVSIEKIRELIGFEPVYPFKSR